MNDALADERWQGLTGGYRKPYDPRPALRKVIDGIDVSAGWDELWNELHHQGDVGEASYAALVPLAAWASDTDAADWNIYALAATIEAHRAQGANPPAPDWLAGAYARALATLFETALRLLPAAQSDELISSVMAVLAIGKQRPALARMALLTEEERIEMLDHVGWG